jgi:hypothetical protein
MKVWKPHPNIYDDNLVKRHDDNSAINTSNQTPCQKSLQLVWDLEFGMSFAIGFGLEGSPLSTF